MNLWLRRNLTLHVSAWMVMQLNWWVLPHFFFVTILSALANTKPSPLLLKWKHSIAIFGNMNCGEEVWTVSWWRHFTHHRESCIFSKATFCSLLVVLYIELTINYISLQYYFFLSNYTSFVYCWKFSHNVFKTTFYTQTYTQVIHHTIDIL